ncbi:MAG: carbohydrate binding family 9 domain-containing protein [Bacteroidales bacterium]|nr:carbohydrate binding family 9 domain-containing protein [Bacteroidales bacterium]
MLKPTIIIVILIISIAPLFADNTEKKIYNTKKTEKAPLIDGLLDEEIWEQVEWSGNFKQSSPNEGEEPSQQTKFKVLYDDNNLYFYIKAYDSEPDKISKLLARRDQFPGDFVEINIDSDFDQQTAFSFSASASGVIGDEAISQNGRNWDSSWNPIWYLKTSIDKEGWNAEIRIPLSQLRFGEKENHIWGLEVMRNLFRKEERSRWQEIPRDAPGFVHLFGELRGIANIKPKKQVDIVPYILAKTESFEKEEGNPYADGSRSNTSLGLDGKIGITNDLTLDFTINPDFGQVEADPSEVNLSAFESYFSEQRPFFVEGKNIFDYRPSSGPVISDYNRDNLFYSRRIGRSPHFYPELNDNEYIDMPESTTIIGAFKLSGKTTKGLSLGIMESVAAEENAKISSMNEERKQTVEPLTNYFVARIQQDFNKGQTIIGGMITAVNRAINSTALEFLPKAAYTGGIDIKHYWKERTYYAALNADFSNIRGDEEAITKLQNSSARYFQRPDATHLRLDETRTTLTGSAASIRLGKSGNGKILFETALTYRSPEFEINDIGYMRTSDAIHHGTWVGYYIRKPFSIFESFFLNNNYWGAVNFDGNLLFFAQNINFNTKFKNKWYLNGSFTHVGDNYSVSALRGGPALIEPGRWSYNINISSDQRKKLHAYFGFYYDRALFNSKNTDNYWLGITYQPIDALSISMQTDLSQNRKELQYIDVFEFEENDRFVFGSLNQKTLSMSFRLNYNITPNLTIQYYGQPFTSAGDYSNYKQITNPQSDTYSDRFQVYSTNQLTYNSSDEVYNVDENRDGITDYSFSKPDFNFSQFRSNMVVRWEYVPGSTLYLVWSQGRTFFDAQGSFDLNQNMNDLFDVHPHNIFLVKFSYRIAI